MMKKFSSMGKEKTRHADAVLLKDLRRTNNGKNQNETYGQQETTVLSCRRSGLAHRVMDALLKNWVITIRSTKQDFFYQCRTRSLLAGNRRTTFGNRRKLLKKNGILKGRTVIIPDEQKKWKKKKKR